MLLAAGVLLTLVFTTVAFLVSLLFEDRAKGLGAALLVWLAATALYDAVLVLVTVAFGDRSLELPLIGLTLLNPVDHTALTLWGAGPLALARRRFGHKDF